MEKSPLAIRKSWAEIGKRAVIIIINKSFYYNKFNLLETV